MKSAKDYLIRMLAAGMGLLTCCLWARAADAPVRYQGQPGASKVLLSGTSSLHPWEMKGRLIGGFVDWAAPVDFDTNQTTLAGLKDGVLPVNVHAIIPVRSIKSEADHLPEYMEALMQKNMKEDKFRNIEFQIVELKAAQTHAIGTPFAFQAKGELAIAGVTNKIDFPVTIAPAGPNMIQIHGETSLKMTSYGVEPPAPDFGMGLMKCGDEVKIIFDWIMVKKQP